MRNYQRGWTLVLLALFACASTTETEGLSATDCQETRQHIAELRMASFQPTGLSEERVAEER